MSQDLRTTNYAQRLSRMIQAETVSENYQTDKTKFYRFHQLLKELFPMITQVCQWEDFDGSFLLRWKGCETNKEPILLMNHHDVVEASGNWKYPPFSGEIAEGKVWGRGTLDNKGGLWAMLQAAEELAKEGFQPKQDIYFVSTCTEETDGSGADKISKTLQERGIRFSMVLDEGGMILEEPIGGAKGKFAMVGLGEKGCADLKFIARSSGGHASTPGKNTPLVRLGKFMAAVEKKNLFQATVSPEVNAMFACVASSMKGPLKFILQHAKLFQPILVKVMPTVSNTANAMLKTTVAFTMAKGSQGTNVLPQEAWVVGNVRFSHHEGREKSIRKITELAAKFDVETEVLDAGFSSPMTSHKSQAFQLVENAVNHVFPTVKTSPYVMTGASDCRYMSRVSENCLRFAPLLITDEQMESIHGIDEHVDVAALAPAVDFYRYMITEA